MGVAAPLKLPRALLSVGLLGGLSVYVFWSKFFNADPPVAHDEATAVGMCIAATFFVRLILASVPLAQPDLCLPLRRMFWSSSTTSHSQPIRNSGSSPSACDASSCTWPAAWWRLRPRWPAWPPLPRLWPVARQALALRRPRGRHPRADRAVPDSACVRLPACDEAGVLLVRRHAPDCCCRYARPPGLAPPPHAAVPHPVHLHLVPRLHPAPLCRALRHERLVLPVHLPCGHHHLPVRAGRGRPKLLLRVHHRCRLPLGLVC